MVYTHVSQNIKYICDYIVTGALHGMMNAEGLAHIMNDLFGNVVYAGIDTDKHKYPIGMLNSFVNSNIICHNIFGKKF